jgi:hypothetical protein
VPGYHGRLADPAEAVHRERYGRAIGDVPPQRRQDAGSVHDVVVRHRPEIREQVEPVHDQGGRLPASPSSSAAGPGLCRLENLPLSIHRQRRTLASAMPIRAR